MNTHLDLVLPDRKLTQELREFATDLRESGDNQAAKLSTLIERAFKERSRESAEKKARRLLGEGRLTVERVSDFVVASCRGDSGEVYRLGFDPRSSQWRCSCVEMKGRCSHLAALMLVVVKPSEAS